jgi:hypothetical protein
MRLEKRTSKCSASFNIKGKELGIICKMRPHVFKAAGKRLPHPATMDNIPEPSKGRSLGLLLQHFA